MSIRFYVGCALLLLAVGCRPRDADRESVDTVMVFAAAPQDSSQGPSMNDVILTMGGYTRKRITADSAARVIVDYLQTHQSLNISLDPELQAAVRREQKQRAHP
jgi:hypothetical protein